ALTGPGRPGGGAIPRRVGAVALQVASELAVRRRGTGERGVDRRGQELEDDLPGGPDALRLGLDVHAGLDLARAGRCEDPRAGDLDDADATDVDRGEVLEPAHRGDVDALGPAGIEDRRAGRGGHLAAVDLQADGGRRLD